MPYIIRQISKNRYSVLNADTGEVHSKSTTLPKAKAQLRILMEAYEKEMKGDGLYDIATSLFNSSTSQPPVVRKLLEEHGGESITDLQVRRMPLSSLLKNLIGYLSWGYVTKMLKKTGYDKLYHLQLYVKTTEGTEFVVEKNERINVLKNTKMNQFTEMAYVGFNKTITVNDLFANTQKYMGPRYYPYNPITNNCQVFINSILDANEINTPELKIFINQPVMEIFSTSPILKKIMDYVIHLGYISNVVLSGGGELIET